MVSERERLKKNNRKAEEKEREREKRQRRGWGWGDNSVARGSHLKAVKQNSLWLISWLQSSAKTAAAEMLHQPVCFHRATCSASQTARMVS